MTYQKGACSPADMAIVAAVMRRHIGPAQAAPIGVIVAECGLPDRRVRAALSALDGVSLLQGETERGRFVCETAEQANAMDGRLRSRALDELIRLRRRRRFARAMGQPYPVAQLELPLLTSAA